MKKIVFFILSLVLSASIHAQELGIRFGDAVGGSVAIDAIFSLGEFSRVHGDLSFGDGVGLELLYDFLYRPLGNEAFDWYVGAGPSFYFNDPFGLGFSGEIGLEYHFVDVPLALGLDWRPTLWLVENTDFYGGGFGFNVRFVFN